MQIIEHKFDFVQKEVFPCFLFFALIAVWFVHAILRVWMILIFVAIAPFRNLTFCLECLPRPFQSFWKS